ncbi:MAG: DUF3373 domain-containing protein [Campylobacterales bacterium]|nr:DUF3373 domain-containing protein [Campylobacterales bacterium]
MLKKILITTLMVSTPFLYGNTIDERIKKLEDKLLLLEKENKKLENTIEDLEDLEERVDDVEKHSYSDKVELTVDLINQRDSFTKTYGNGKSYLDDDMWSTKAMINLKSKENERFKFTGRVSMYKYWGDWGDGDGYKYKDDALYQGRIPVDSTLYFERAYVDWFINPESNLPFVFSIGRMPTADGPSNQFRKDGKISSNYPAGIMEAVLDGMLISGNFEKLTGVANSAVRVGYMKLSTDFEGNSTRQNVDIYSGKGRKNQYEDQLGIGFFLESSIPSIEDSFFQYSYTIAKDYGSSQDLEKLQAVSDNYNLGEDVGPLGDLYLSSYLLEVKNIQDSMDFFLQYSQSNYKPTAFDKKVVATALSKEIKETTGNSYWIGTRYQLPIQSKPKIGFEYNKGSRNWLSGVLTPSYLNYKLLTRGEAYELYYIQPIGGGNNITFGFVNIDYKYTDSSDRYVGKEISSLTSGEKASTIDKLTNAYIRLQFSF